MTYGYTHRTPLVCPCACACEQQHASCVPYPSTPPPPQGAQTHAGSMGGGEYRAKQAGAQLYLRRVPGIFSSLATVLRRGLSFV
jgi:hypothetical protein